MSESSADEVCELLLWVVGVCQRAVLGGKVLYECLLDFFFFRQLFPFLKGEKIIEICLMKQLNLT